MLSFIPVRNFYNQKLLFSFFNQYLQKRKLGSDDLISSFVRRIENTTEENFLRFQQENDEKRKTFIVSY